MSITADRIGSVGTLIGAAMETAGHYMQSEFLDVLTQEQLAQQLGGLVYAISIVTALFIIAVGGQYKFGLWFLVGPPIFFFMIFVRTNSSGAIWRFGTREYDVKEVDRLTKDAIPESAGSGGGRKTARVSLFFSKYDQLTSGAVQAFVSLLRLEDSWSDANFVSKMQKFYNLKDPKWLDGNMMTWFSQVFSNNCGRYLLLLRDLSDPGTNLIGREQDKQAITEELKKLRSTLTFNDQRDISYAMDWAARALPQETANKWKEKLKAGFTCPDLWTLALEIYRARAVLLVDDIIAYTLPPQCQASEECKEKYRKMIMKKFSYEVRTDSGAVETRRISDEEALHYLINEVTARLVLKNLALLLPNHIADEAGREPSAMPVRGNMAVINTPRQLRVLQATEKYQSVGDFLSGALSMPYIQGLGLYFLALSFPFFAFTIIVPGRHHGFFLWMGLWFWLKSWDIGFAIVMEIDNMLFALMPQGPPIKDLMSNSEEAIARTFKDLLTVDPTYTQHTYFNLVAVCLLAVPVVSAALIKKGGSEFAHALNQGFSNFCGKIGESMTSYSRSLLSQTRARDVEANKLNAALESFWGAMHNDPKIRGAITARLGMELGKSKMRDNAAENPQIQKMGWKLAEELMAAPIDRQNQILLERWKLYTTKAVYDESKNDLNLSYAAEAVSLRFNSHDWRDSYKSVASQAFRVWATENYYFKTGSLYRQLQNVPANMIGAKE